MARILLLLIIGFILYLLFRGFVRVNTKKDGEPPATSDRGEDMVTCAKCGVNMPRSEAKEQEGRMVCANNPQCR